MTKEEKEFIDEILEPALRNGHGTELYWSLSRDAQRDDWERYRFMQEMYCRVMNLEPCRCFVFGNTKR